MPYITCDACSFWVKPSKMEGQGGPEELGQCRKYAPMPYHNPPERKAPKAHWPLTDSDDGCGEGEFKEERARKGKAA